jgi:preprotein translocase subunit SecD
MDRRYVKLLLILILVALVVWVDIPRADGSSGLTIGKFHRTMNPVLGLDLRGGMQVLLAGLVSVKLFSRLPAIVISWVNFQDLPIPKM